MLLAHVLLVYGLMRVHGSAPREISAGFETAPVTMMLPAPSPEPATPAALLEAPAVAMTPPVELPLDASTGESSAITTTPDAGRVDWPQEGRKAAARLLAREAEAERLARLFAGPGGTWASLTKRQRSKLNQFRWKKGVQGVEYDSQGNQIYRISEGCVIVNSLFFGCAIGKPRVNDDMFENMRLYFDEQRLPDTGEGNGTEPEARR